MNEEEIRSFWQDHPCGEGLVGGVHEHEKIQEFFNRYDEYRYDKEAHILRCLDHIDFSGKDTLEVGLGQGADGEQIVRRGAIYSGLDLTEESVLRIKRRFEVRNLDYQEIKQGSVLDMPFESKSFDIVFSHGVLHHVPDIIDAQREIWRILKPGGHLVTMLYAKWSLNYLISIGIVRRLGLIALSMGAKSSNSMYKLHLKNAREMGLFRYLRMKNFIHRNTDGPLNPYSKVYDTNLVRKDFPLFELSQSYKRFMHAPPLPVRSLPLESVCGWHLWVHLTPKEKA